MRKKIAPRIHPPEAVQEFFASSDWLDRMALRPLSHIAPNWETVPDPTTGMYKPEPGSFAADLNIIIDLMAATPRPAAYHDAEDALVENIRHRWPVQKVKGRWEPYDYPSLLEQGSFRDAEQSLLLSSASGRTHTALDHGCSHFDKLDIGHLRMLAAVITLIVYHRYNDGSSILEALSSGSADC